MSRDSRNEAAWRAAAAFRRMVPTLNAYARALTGRSDVRVVPHSKSNGSTDGRTIYYRPPYSLGIQMRHDSFLCEKRDEQLQLECPACAQREEVLVVIFHEIAHIAFDTFRKPSSESIKSLLERAIAVGDSALARRAERHLSTTARFSSYMDMAGAISPWLPHVYNSLEDARVNAHMFQARPGVRIMFEALIERVRHHGVGDVTGHREGEDEEIWTTWDEQPLNSQIITVLFMHAGGYVCEGMFAPEVYDVIADEQLLGLLADVEVSADTEVVYETALPVLARCQQLGYLMTPAEEQDQEEEKGDDGDSDDCADTRDGWIPDDPAAESDVGGLSSRPTDATAEEKGLPRYGSLVLDALCGYGDEHQHEDEALPVHILKSDDDSSLEKSAISRALVQAVHFEQPSAEVGQLRVISYPDWVADYQDHPIIGRVFSTDQQPLETSPTTLGPALLCMRAALAENSIHKNRRNLRAGKVDVTRLSRRVATGDDRLFQKKAYPGRKSYDVTIGLDISGSTVRGLDRIIRTCALMQGELCSRTGVEFSIFAHTGILDYEAEDSSSLGYDVTLFQIKGRTEPWSASVRARLDQLSTLWCNLDGHTLQYYRKHAQASRATDKIILYFTDGAMPCENYEEEKAILEEEVEQCRKLGITLLCISLENDDPAEYGIDFVRIDSSEEIHLAVDALAGLMSKTR